MDTVFQVQITPSNAVDGLAPDTSGYLYGVDTGGRIIKYDLASQTASVFVYTGLAPATQDIYFDKWNNRLLAIGYSTNAPLQAINLDDSTVETVVVTSGSNYDGITMDIYGNKVAILMWTEPPEAVIIENKSVADSFRDYFEILWKSARK